MIWGSSEALALLGWLFGSPKRTVSPNVAVNSHVLNPFSGLEASCDSAFCLADGMVRAPQCTSEGSDHERSFNQHLHFTSRPFSSREAAAQNSDDRGFSEPRPCGAGLMRPSGYTMSLCDEVICHEGLVCLHWRPSSRASVHTSAAYYFYPSGVIKVATELLDPKHRCCTRSESLLVITRHVIHRVTGDICCQSGFHPNIHQADGLRAIPTL